MKKQYRYYLLFFTLFFFCCSNRLCANMVSVYVDHKPLKAGYIVILDEIFVPAEALCKVLKEKIVWDPDSLWISLGGREIAMKALVVKDEVYLPLKAVVREIGYEMEIDEAKGILRVDTSKKVTAEEQGEKQETRRRKQVTITLFQEDPIINVLKQVTALRVFADVENEKRRPVTNLEAHCLFTHPEGAHPLGKLYHDDVIEIERLGPGEKKRIVFYTTNPIVTEKLNYKLEIVKKQIKEK